MKFWLLGITFSVTVTFGTYVLGFSHVTGGETRVSNARALGPAQNGTSTCIWDCAPDSKVESFQAVDFSHGGLVALSATRSNGEFSADVGLQKEFALPVEGASITFAATKSLHGEDAIRFLHLPVVRSAVPDRVNNYIKDYEARKAAESVERLARFNRLSKPKALIRDTSTAGIRPNEQLIRAICTADVSGIRGAQETSLQKVLRQYECMRKFGVTSSFK